MDKALEEIVFIVEEAAEGGYTARALGTSIFTEAGDFNQLKLQVIDAVRCHFAGKSNLSTHPTYQFKIDPSSICRYTLPQ